MSTQSKPKNILLKFFENVEMYICILTILAVVVIIFGEVVARYIFNHSFSWSEEVGRVLIVWITFGGSAYAFRMGAHIGVTYFYDKLKGNAKKYAYVLIQLVSIVFFIVLAYYGATYTYSQWIHGQLMPATRISVAWAYSSIPVGSILVIIRLSIEAVTNTIHWDRRCLEQ